MINPIIDAMKDEQKSQDAGEREGAAFLLPKVLSILLFLIFIVALLLGAGSWYLNKNSDVTNNNLSQATVLLNLVASDARELLSDGISVKKVRAGAMIENIRGVDHNLKLALNAAPIHLREKSALLQRGGLFDEEYNQILNTGKSRWDEIKREFGEVNGELNADQLVKNTQKENLFNVANLVEGVQGSLSGAQAKVANTSKVLDLFSMIAGVLLAVIILSLLFLLLSLLTKLKSMGKKVQRLNQNLLASEEQFKRTSLELSNSNKELQADALARESNLDISPPTEIQESEDMNNSKKEVSRLRVLCETLFNDRYRPLCIIDEDGDILMENNACKKVLTRNEEEEHLPTIMQGLLSKTHYNKFYGAFQSFFLAENQDGLGDFPTLEGIKLPHTDLGHRISFQPFKSQDGELCSLIGLQETTGDNKIGVIQSPSDTDRKEIDPPVAVNPEVETVKESIENEVQQVRDIAVSHEDVSQSLGEKVSEKVDQVEDSFSDYKSTVLEDLPEVPTFPSKKESVVSKREPHEKIEVDHDVVIPHSGIKRPNITKPNKFTTSSRATRLAKLSKAETKGEPDPFESEAVGFAIVPVLRDLLDKLGSVNSKEIELDTSDFDESLIPENLKPTLLETIGQAIKFCVPNSIESPEDRLTQGKSNPAIIKLTNSYENNIKGLDQAGLIINYKDNGHGISPQLIFDVAKKAGITNKRKVEELTKNEILSYLFNSQFNLPKKHALDVVNLVRLKDTVVKNLKGKMRLSYQEGESFSFQLLVPTKK